MASFSFLYLPAELLWKSYQAVEISTVDYFLSGVIPIFLLIGLVRVTKVGWYTLVAMVTLWGMRDLWSYYQESGATLQFAIHIGIYLFSITYFINPRIRHVYFDPKLRWWRVKTRYETHVPFMLSHDSIWHYPILRNISESGCFVETPHLASVSDMVQITIPLPIPLGVSVIQAEGEVRWVSRNPLRYGMGVQFKEPLPQHEKAIKEFVRQHL